ncbi:MAG: hypothetical protein A2806_04075 [Candidatus Terrybacteria bacterium RIFCSPHIGHO2_01_FULL_48_17]|uniref:Uncharacterized protein n=1 Tax=Candidatus Terrybacteria bacterium RIFCSPHIGHO2_01_FULL_48_17 TaxID=1802362 RepID=A0A1G2PKG6_9BACT|nr:MAG: hypothetical protein A2806_04075 [Candidatus Terrybacteria bacterium RIFCSPHIGHO2_01_FULL_48_17]OHA53748.1 MAG: hypothetical protein A3A30_05260 [Candidatus Terrybacteria bacterium RIFCSPLOWO2_01_FULL_48_14]
MESSAEHTGEQQKDNLHRGIDIVMEIAARHEQKLRELIERKGGEMPINPIVDGPITSEGLSNEFETLAREHGVDLEDFYQRAGSWTLFGHQFEGAAWYQILMHHVREGQKH